MSKKAEDAARELIPSSGSTKDIVKMPFRDLSVALRDI